MPRALVVGVNYAGQSCALRGCAHDANSLAEYLGERGYAVERLIDSEDPEDLKDSSSARTWNSPTRANILKGLLDLVLSGDSNLFFSFAGHGSRRYDASGDETDGRDEVLCPVDLNKGMLTDDALRGVLQCLQPHQKLFCVLDCCHSGTGMDLKYELYDRGGSSYRFIPGEGKTDTPGHVFLLSGCRDSQTSAESLVTTTTQQADGSIATEREIRGALTSTLVPILKRTEAAPRCDRLLSELRKTLQMGGFSQIAQLSAGRRESPLAQLPLV